MNCMVGGWSRVIARQNAKGILRLRGRNGLFLVFKFIWFSNQIFFSPGGTEIGHGHDRESERGACGREAANVGRKDQTQTGTRNVRVQGKQYMLREQQPP